MTWHTDNGEGQWSVLWDKRKRADTLCERHCVAYSVGNTSVVFTEMTSYKFVGGSSLRQQDFYFTFVYTCVLWVCIYLHVIQEQQ
jgi:hypothetical protein